MKTTSTSGQRVFQFFSYYGAKMRQAKLYPPPRFPLIVEPFAGSAGYSTNHHTRKVILYDIYRPVVDAWKWLIRATHDDVMDLPLLGPEESLAGKGLDDGAKALIGYWCHRAGATPRDKLSSWSSKWATRFWSPEIRMKIANQVHLINHWECHQGSYKDAPDVEATWYVDPPYVTGGHYYPNGTKSIEYEHLASWCRSRAGQTIVCEQDSASWLPFRELYRHTGIMRQPRVEVVWTNG